MGASHGLPVWGLCVTWGLLAKAAKLHSRGAGENEFMALVGRTYRWCYLHMAKQRGEGEASSAFIINLKLPDEAAFSPTPSLLAQQHLPLHFSLRKNNEESSLWARVPVWSVPWLLQRFSVPVIFILTTVCVCSGLRKFTVTTMLLILTLKTKYSLSTRSLQTAWVMPEMIERVAAVPINLVSSGRWNQGVGLP